MIPLTTGIKGVTDFVKSWANDPRKFLASVFHLLVVIGVLIWILWLYLGPQMKGPTLKITANVEKNGTTAYDLKGRVRKTEDGSQVRDAQVWVVLEYGDAGRVSPPDVKTDEHGGFTVSSIETQIGRSALMDIEINAVFEDVNTMTGRRKIFKGAHKHRVADKGGTRPRIVDFPFRSFGILPFIFFASLLVPFIGKAGSFRHAVSLILAVLFTVAMIAYIAVGLRFVHSMEPDEILNLGWASVFNGTYIHDIQPEWLISISSPVLSTANLGVAGEEILPASGFGAPLWVLLLAVIGAALLTVSLMVKEIGARPDVDDETEMRKSGERIVRHQFFIFFAPLGAIFIYQLLLAGKAANEPITVAIAALGAGATLNALLNRAIAESQKMVGWGAKSENNNGGNNNQNQSSGNDSNNNKSTPTRN